ncbi:hypothetical protein C0995_005891 [Termitomyces sp. Mi166|nr:hypothetical protein C0995_005891 [Termitomyces sp. Mi166\
MNAISSTINSASPHPCLLIPKLITLIWASLYLDRPSSAVGTKTKYMYLKNLAAMASPSAITDQHVFPALQFLSFLCDDHEAAVELKLLQNSKLVKVRISFHQQFTDWYEWDALLQVLSKVSHSSLISISLHDLAKMSSIEEFEYEPLAFVSLRPLLAFTHLQTLVIFVAQGINYNDATIDELARALPRVEQRRQGTVLLTCNLDTRASRRGMHRQ